LIDMQTIVSSSYWTSRTRWSLNDAWPIICPRFWSSEGPITPTSRAWWWNQPLTGTGSSMAWWRQTIGCIWPTRSRCNN